MKKRVFYFLIKMHAGKVTEMGKSDMKRRTRSQNQFSLYINKHFQFSVSLEVLRGTFDVNGVLLSRGLMDIITCTKGWEKA